MLIFKDMQPVQKLFNQCSVYVWFISNTDVTVNKHQWNYFPATHFKENLVIVTAQLADLISRAENGKFSTI